MAKILNSRKGQVMLLSVLTLGAVMLGATAISGFLVLYQIRMSSNYADSATAIFAADAGIEWGIYEFTKPTSTPPSVTFNNGAHFDVICKDGTGAAVQCTNASTTLIRSTGYFRSATRVFELNL